MRYLVGFVLLLIGVGALRVVGCGEEDPCDDGNECTLDVYRPKTDECDYYARGGEPCNFDGDPGRCNGTSCEEDRCPDDKCDDGDICSDDQCDVATGECYHYNAGFAGEPCTRNGLPGVCLSWGWTCRTFDCPHAVCDDGDACTDDWCHLNDDECGSSAKNCSDDNACTDDACDPDTGCFNTPKPDGQYCCYRGHWECAQFLCFWKDYVCDVAGYCDSGACIE